MVGAAFSQFTAFLSLDGADADLTQRTVVASFGADVGGSWTLTASAGGVLGGDRETGGVIEAVGAGWIAGISGAYHAVAADGGIPFVDLSVAFAAAGATTTTPGVSDNSGLLAFDLRLGATVGWRLWETVAPYLAVRVFGGPVIHDRPTGSVKGSDRGHVQAAVGATVYIPGGVMVYGEYAPVYERSFSAGLAVGF